MQETAMSYFWALDAILIAFGIFVFYIIYRTHPCWKIFLVLHGIFTLDAYYIEKFPFAFSFALIAFILFILSLFYLRGEMGERLNQLIDEKILKRFSLKH